MYILYYRGIYARELCKRDMRRDDVRVNAWVACATITEWKGDKERERERERDNAGGDLHACASAISDVGNSAALNARICLSRTYVRVLHNAQARGDSMLTSNIIGIYTRFTRGTPPIQRDR